MAEEEKFQVTITVASFDEGAAVAQHLGTLDRTLGTDCHIVIGPVPVEFVKALTSSGSGLGVHVDRPVLDALDLVRGDLVKMTIQRA